MGSYLEERDAAAEQIENADINRMKTLALKLSNPTIGPKSFYDAAQKGADWCLTESSVVRALVEALRRSALAISNASFWTKEYSGGFVNQEIEAASIILKAYESAVASIKEGT